METIEQNEKQKLPIEIELDYPVEFGKETITSVVIKRRITGKDMKDIPASFTFGDMQKLASRLTGLSPAVFEKMDVTDIRKINDAITDFL